MFETILRSWRTPKIIKCTLYPQVVLCTGDIIFHCLIDPVFVIPSQLVCCRLTSDKSEQGCCLTSLSTSRLSCTACQELTCAPVWAFCRFSDLPHWLPVWLPAAPPVNWHQLQVAAFASASHEQRCLCHPACHGITSKSFHYDFHIVWGGELWIKIWSSQY